MVVIGLPAGGFLKAPIFEFVVRMVTIKGSYVGNRKDTSEAIEFFRRGLIKSPFKTVGMSKLQEVYDLMRKYTETIRLRDVQTDLAVDKNQIAGRYVVDTSK